MEVEGGGLYTYRYTVTTRMASALRWAAMRAVLMFRYEVLDKVTRQSVHKPQPTTGRTRRDGLYHRPIYMIYMYRSMDYTL